MKKLINCILMLATALMLASTAFAADRTYYSYPDATTVPDNARILMYDPAAGSKNVTGAKLRTSVSDTPISSQPISTDPYKRTYESRDATTNAINFYVQANGTVTVVNSLIIGGNPPAPISVSSISPANGSTGFIGGPITITFNKNPNGTSGSAIYVDGVTTTNAYSSSSNASIISTAYLAPNTSYTFKVNRTTLASLQTDGETTSSCGTAMTEVSGVCQSTFTTAYLKIYSVEPVAGGTNIVGTDGTTSWNVLPRITFGTTKVLTAGQFTCSSSYWNGASWVADTTPGAFANTSNAIYTLPSMIFHKSYDESHLTTYTCSVPKSIGLTTCDAGTTDTGTLCQWTFITAL